MPILQARRMTQLFGALVLTSVSDWLSAHLVSLADLFHGVIIILVVLFMPRGLSDLAGERHFSLRYFIRNVREHRI